MKLILTLFLITNLFANKITDLITQKYKETYPSIEIKNIKLTNFSNKKITKINSINTRLINTKKTTGTIIVNKDIYLRYKIDAFIYVVKTKKSIKRNSPITLSNSKVAKIKFFNLFSYPMSPLDIGKLSVRNYTPKDKIIYDYNTRKEILVKRGDMINVISKNSEIELTFRAKALNDGSKGEMISIEINNAKRKAKVIANNLVEIQ